MPSDGTAAVIEELHIRGLGVIEEASLRLSPGLTVVTGETGAGKTMLVTALELLLGARSDAALVRTGSPAAYVEAVVSPAPEEASEWTDDADALIVSREIPQDGRSRARMGGRLVPVGTLTEILGGHVEVHAQHEHVRLARPEVQRHLLDRYAGPTHHELLDDYRRSYASWRELVGRRERLEADARSRTWELERLRFELDEIDSAQLDPKLDGRIDRELAVLTHADELQHAVHTATSALGAEGAIDALGTAVEALRRLDVDDDALDVFRTRLDGIVAETTELSADLRAYLDAIDADPARLAQLQERKQLLSTLMRKYGADVGAVVAHADHARSQVERLEADQADASELDARIAELESSLGEVAGEIHTGRRTAGDELEKVVAGHLADLGMPHARLQIDVERLADGQLGADGGDRVTYLLAPNPGEPARPLARAASGGERSRVSLAIEVALADVDEAEVLVFDEVDAGIGGATAMAVGEKLARLAAGEGARNRQVLCVTHLAQLAAFADVHHVVEKGVVDGRTVTTSRHVADRARVGELARMLGGDPDAPEGREHARALLEQAGRNGPG